MLNKTKLDQNTILYLVSFDKISTESQSKYDKFDLYSSYC